MDEWAVERVLTCVEQIPPGRVAAYGEVGAIAGTGPRHVGLILREYGAAVPWWRVVSASGEVAEPLRQRAAEEWVLEGIAWRADRRGCRMADHRADLEALAAAYEVEIATRRPPEGSG